MHKPRTLENSDKTAVIFIHGFMGSPCQFDSLATATYDNGYSAISLLLPGHGATLKDFSNATLEDWTAHVDAEVGRLAKTYDRIFVVGHSMGCLLAINATLKYAEHIHGLFLIYCPFKLGYLSFVAIKARIRQIFSKKSSPIKLAYRTACGVPISPSIVWRIMKPTLELKKLISITIGNLSDIHTPVTAIYSLSDEVVSASSLGIFEHGAINTPIKSILLTDSQHAYFTEDEQAKIENALLNNIS